MGHPCGSYVAASVRRLAFRELPIVWSAEDSVGALALHFGGEAGSVGFRWDVQCLWSLLWAVFCARITRVHRGGAPCTGVLPPSANAERHLEGHSLPRSGWIDVFRAGLLTPFGTCSRRPAVAAGRATRRKGAMGGWTISIVLFVVIAGASAGLLAYRRRAIPTESRSVNAPRAGAQPVKKPEQWGVRVASPDKEAGLFARAQTLGQGVPHQGKAAAAVGGLSFSSRVRMPLHKTVRPPQRRTALRSRAAKTRRALRQGQPASPRGRPTQKYILVLTPERLRPGKRGVDPTQSALHHPGVAWVRRIQPGGLDVHESARSYRRFEAVGQGRGPCDQLAQALKARIAVLYATPAFQRRKPCSTAAARCRGA